MRTPVPDTAASGTPIFDLGSIAVAGLLGGPIAVGLLAGKNIQQLGLSQRAPLALALLLVAVGAWHFIAISTPPDFISQLIPLLPQVALWWLCARGFLRQAHRQHSALGGRYRSVWLAVGLGILVSAATKLVFWLVTSPSA